MRALNVGVVKGSEMRIGLLTSIPETVDAFFLPWIAEWQVRGDYVAVAAGPSSRGRQASPAVTVVHGLRQSPRPRLMSAPGALRRWVRDNSLDVVLTSTATASAAARLLPLGAPVVYFCHGLHWGGQQAPSDRIYQHVERLLVHRTAAVIVMNRADRLWFENLARPPRMLALTAGIGLDLTEWPRRAQAPASTSLDLVWIGAFTERKRPFDALTVVERLRDAGLPTTLTMLGSGPLASEVADRVRGLGHIRLVGRTDPHPYLLEASALLHTAEWEGLSRVLLEGTASGVQCFGFDTKGVSDCPGVKAVGQPGDCRQLAALILDWWSRGAPSPEVDEQQLDWRHAFESVSSLLSQFSPNRPPNDGADIAPEQAPN